MKTNTFILSYQPPSNIRKMIIDIQVSLFREYRAPSAIAFPPSIPLAYPSEPAEDYKIREKFEPRGCSFSIGGCRVIGRSLFLEIYIDPDFIIPSNMLSESDQRFPIPVFRGFHLISEEKNLPSLLRIAEKINLPEETSWSAGYIELLKISWNSDDLFWWKEINIEELWQYRVKKRR